MMLARRHDNENAIYEQQQAAAGKPLNQGIKGLAPKTPGNPPPKTPVGKKKSDENAAQPFGNGGAKGGKAERNAFVTPANPRVRAPLGNKTTNAKAFQTPAPLKVPDPGQKSERLSSNKPTSPRLRRSKIKVHESTSVDNDILSQEPEEREIEYMPPREIPLPDHDDDVWPHDRAYPQFQGKNLTRGWWSEYAPGRDKSEDDPDLSDYEENLKKCEQRSKQKGEASEAKVGSMAATSTNGTRSRAAPTVKRAQDAAAALARKPATIVASHSAAGKTRLPITSTVKKPMFDKGNPRFTAAKAASNSTIGYSKGRVVSAQRRPLTDIHARPQSSTTSEATEEKKKNTLDDLLSLGGLDIADEDGDLGFSGSKGVMTFLDEDGDEPELFQLDPIQDL